MSPKVYSFFLSVTDLSSLQVSVWSDLFIFTKFLMTIMAQVFICSATLHTLQVGFPDGTVVKNLPANARDMGLSPGPGRSHMLRSN